MREYSRTFRRLLAAALGVSLLVAFWAERPVGVAHTTSLPPETVAALRGDAEPAAPRSTSIIGVIRRPWLAGYTLFGAPDVSRAMPDDEGSARFRTAVGRLAIFLFALGAFLWWRGGRIITQARRA